MSDAFSVVYLARHGETAWTISRPHTGVTDLPLTPQGEAEAVRLGEWLGGSRFAAVLTAPCSGAGGPKLRTGGFGSKAEVEPDLREWDCGTHEGRTSADIHAPGDDRERSLC